MKPISTTRVRIAHANSWARGWITPMLEGIKRARTMGLAAEMSFWLFLSLVPLAAVAALVAARLAAVRGSMAASLLASVPGDVRKMIETQLQQLAAWHGGAVAPLAIGTFVWLAASGVHSIFDALEVQTGLSRPWWKQRLLAIATCVALSLGVAALGLLATGLGWVSQLAGKGVPAPMHAAWSYAFRIIAGFAIAIAMVMGLYKVGIPREARSVVPTLPGAVMAVALIGTLGWGYGVYVSAAGDSGAYVGGLATIGVTMMTLWLFSVALLLGAELNKVVAHRRAGAGAAHPVVDDLLPGRRVKWPTFNVFWSRPTSRKPPTEPSNTPSRSRPGWGRSSR